MGDCVFCKIADHTISGSVVYEDDQVMAFRDLNPCTPVHLLIIPKNHISGIQEISEADGALISKIILVAKQLAKEFSIDEGGYRIVVNSGPDAGQSVAHLHFHLLGGQRMGWPPI